MISYKEAVAKICNLTTKLDTLETQRVTLVNRIEDEENFCSLARVERDATYGQHQKELIKKIKACEKDIESCKKQINKIDGKHEEIERKIYGLYLQYNVG